MEPKIQNQQSPFDILVVDDTPDKLKLLDELLSEQGYHVLQANNGELALRIAAASQPDLILLNIKMIPLDGYEVCRRLKANESTRHIPVIFISAHDDEALLVKGFETGGVDFISEPFRNEEIRARIKTHLQLHFSQRKLKDKNQLLEKEVLKRKSAEVALEKRVGAMTQLFENETEYEFEELFNLNEIQKLQDQFATALGLASIITKPDGTPITQPSNFTHLCKNIIRSTDKGLKNCMHSDSVIGRHNPNGPIIQPCLSGSLWDAGASITVGGYHLANWMIGQVRNEVQHEAKLKDYALEIGVDEKLFMEALDKIPSMSRDQFQKIADVLFTMAGQLSHMAYQNLQQAHFINDKRIALNALIESEEHFRTTLYSIGDGVITTDEKGRVQLMNNLAEKLTGWSQSEAKGKLLEEVFRIINENTLELLEIPVRKVLREGVIVGLANHTLLISKEGKQIPIADSGAPIHDESGKIIGVVLVFRDQTNERRAEHALRESEKRFKLLYENAPLSYQSLNSDACLIDVNNTWLETLGYSREEVLGKPFSNFMTPESAELIKTRFPHFVATGEIHDYVFDMVRKDGSIITVTYEGKIGCDELGNFIRTHCIFADITEKRRAELALLDSENKFRTIIESSPYGMHLYQLTTADQLVFIGGNPSADRMLEVEHANLVNLTIDEAFPSLVGTGIPELFKSVAVGNTGTTSFEMPYNDSQISGFYNVTVFRTGENNIVVNFVDETKRKQAEEEKSRLLDEVAQSEKKFRSLFENATVGFSMTQLGGEIDINHAFANMLGYEPEELKRINWKEITHPDDLQESQNVMNLLLSGEQSCHRYEKRYLHKLGAIVWADVSTILQRDEKGDPLYFITNVNNINQRKEAEDKLRESEIRSRSTFDQSPVGSVIVGLDKKFIKCNAAFCKFLGYTEEELMGKTFSDVTFPEDIGIEMPDLKLMFDGKKESSTVEKRYVRKDGAIVWGEVRFSLVRDKDNNPVYFLPVIQDITNRKLTEQALFESEEKFSTSFHNAPILISLVDLETGVYIDVNEESLRVSGFDRSEIIGYSASELGWISAEARQQIYAEIQSKGRIDNMEVDFRAKDGRKISGILKGELINLKGRKCLLTTAVDISERKQIEEEIKKERSLLRTLIDNLPNTVYVKDLQGRKLIANKADVDFIGLDFKEVIGKTDIELFSGENGQHGYDEDMEVMNTGIPITNLEECFYDNLGEKRWLVTSKIPLCDENGKVYGMVGTGRDVTDQHRDHETIQKLTKSIEQSPSTIVITDTEGTIQYVNPKFCEITGYRVEEAIGNNPRILKSGEMPAEKYKELWDTISSGGVWRGEFHNKKKNGELYWEWATMTSIKDDRGEIINYIAIKEDIGLRKQMELDLLRSNENLERSQELLNVTGEIAKVGGWELDIISNTLTWTKEVYTIHQVEDVFQPTVEKALNFYDSRSKPIIAEAMGNAIKKGIPYDLELVINSAKGKKIDVRAQGYIKRDKNRKIERIFGTFQDISEHKINERELIAAKEKAEENDRLKSAFLANMSHEIRTPLNCILGFTDLLCEPDLEAADREEFSKLVTTSGNNLLSVINDILDISRIESGQMKILKSKFKVQNVINEIIGEFENKITQQGLSLRIAPVVFQKDITIESDEARIKQVLINFMTNAIKFTDKGFIEIGFKNDGVAIQFYVKDSGIGIPKENHQNIFERFRQVETSHTRKYGGNGLGLAISKKLIEMLGGKIGMESEPGKGSCFFFIIPLQ